MFVFEHDASGGGDVVEVSGPTHLNAVDCRRFEATGATKVDDDVRAERVDVGGSTSVGGDLTADRLEATGSLGVAGALAAEEATLSGSVRVDGSTAVSALRTEGSAKFDDLACDDLSARGALVATRVVADEVAVRGAIEAESLAADDVVLVLEEDSTVDQLTGDDVRVERGDGGGTLAAGSVTGDTVHLEATRAETVTGDSVSIGPGCEVGTVRSPDPEIHPDARVETVREATGP